MFLGKNKKGVKWKRWCSVSLCKEEALLQSPLLLALLGQVKELQSRNQQIFKAL